MTENTRLLNRFFAKPRRTAAATALLILLAGLVLGWQFSIRHESGILAEKRQDAEVQLALHGSTLGSMLSHHFELLNVLKAFTLVELNSPAEHIGQTFRALATALHSNVSCLRNLSIAPGGVQKYVYPLKGNENVLGHNLLRDKRPAIQADVARAIETGEITSGGPYELRQGGLGLVGRQAVYEKGQFWGLITIVLDLPPVLAAAGLNNENGLTRFVLQDHDGKVFFGDSSILTKQPVSYQISLPEQTWILSAAPADGWQVSQQIIWPVNVSVIFIPLLLAALAYQLIYRHVRLEQLVVQRTEELHESEYRFRSLFENTEISVWDEDLSEVRKALDKLRLDGVKDLRRYLQENRQVVGSLIDTVHVTHVNQATLGLFGATDEDEMLYKIDSTFGPNAMEVFIDELCAIWDNKKCFRAEAEFRTIDGRELIAILSFNIPETEEGYKSIPINIVNITELKRAKENQTKLNIQLKAKNKELEQMVSVTSHDLRAPLISIKGFSGRMGKSLENILTVLESAEFSAEIEEQLEPSINNSRESIEFISKGVAKMDLLLEGLSRVSRLGKVEIRKENLDMNMLLTNIQDDFQFQSDEQEARIKISELPSCLGDKRHISQLFTNLIGNALKYSNPDQSAVISISGRKEGAHSVYCVEDNGIGIVPEFQEKIFDMFRQLNPEAAGEGLGLNIVRKIAERHDGRIWVESEPGKGSRFYVALPRNFNHAGESQFEKENES